MAIVFESTVQAVFSDLSGAPSQRLYHLSDGVGTDAISFGNVDNTNNIRLTVQQNGQTFTLTVPNAIVEGASALWHVTIDDAGTYTISKDGVVVASQTLGVEAIPTDVPRTESLIGDSPNAGENALDGTIDSVQFDTLLFNGFDFAYSEAGYPLGSVGGSSQGETLDASALTDGLLLSGAGGADTLTGGTGADTISGGLGNDELIGGDGDDTLDGGAGGDTLSGGGGDDRFVFDEIDTPIIITTAGSWDNYTGIAEQINTFETGYQSPPKIITLADGRTMHLWVNEGHTDGSTNADVQVRIYNADGTVATDQFNIEDNSPDGNFSAVDGWQGFDWDAMDVDLLPDGNVMVSFVTSGGDTGAPDYEHPAFFILEPTQYGINVAVDETKIAEFDNVIYQTPPITTVLDNGTVMFVWGENGTGDAMDLNGRVYDPATDTFQPQFVVGVDQAGTGNIRADGTDTADVPNMEIVQLSGGNIVVTYVRSSAEPGGTEPVFTVLDSNGATITAVTEMQATDTTTFESPAQIVALDDGNFMGIWILNGYSEDTNTMQLEGRIFDPTGSPLTGDIDLTGNGYSVDGWNSYDIPNFTIDTLGPDRVLVTYVNGSVNDGGISINNDSDMPHFSILNVSNPANPVFVVQDQHIIDVPGDRFPGPALVEPLGDSGYFVAVYGQDDAAYGAAYGLNYRVFDVDGNALTLDVPIVANGSPMAVSGLNNFDWNNIDIEVNEIAGTFTVGWVGANDGSVTGVYSSGPISVADLMGTNLGGEVVIGGETGEVDGDTLDLTAVTAALSATYGDTEEGQIVDDATGYTLDFSEIEHLQSGSGDDTIDASAATGGVDIHAGAGADSVTGGIGNDTILGGDNADTISGGEGDDLIDGGEGDDLLSSGLGQDTLLGGAGNDTLLNSNGDDLLIGGTGDDSMVATGGEDTLVGGEGNDTMEGGDDADTFIIEDTFGNDFITGGEGTTDPTDEDYDTIDLSAVTSPVTVTYDTNGPESGTITDGTHTLTFEEIERLILTEQNDSVNGNFATFDLSVDAGAGDDTLTGGARNNTLAGGAGDDLFNVGVGDDSIVGGTGTDTLSIAGANDTIDLTFNSDGAGTFTDNDGDSGTFSGIEAVVGSAGNDTIDATGDSLGVSVEGGDGLDTITGGSGNDTINAGTGADVIDAGPGADSVLAGDGNDTVLGGSGADTIDGGNNNDSIDGGLDADSLFGGDGNDTIEGGEGADTIIGAVGNDTISGGTGDDVLVGGGGADTVSGGDGNDILVGGSNGNTFPGGGDNTTTGNDILDGGAGNDTIYGNVGSDTLEGGADDDLLLGQWGSDSLSGGAGNDSLVGAVGNDTLTGGDGNDTFSYSAGDGNDTITDFGVGNTGPIGDRNELNNDFIDLSAFFSDVEEMRADYDDDGVFNHSNAATADYSDNVSFAGGSVHVTNATSSLEFTTDNTGVACFTQGTKIRTPQGQVAIETLRVGDLVETADHGPQPIRWIGKRDVSDTELLENQNLRPIRIRKEAVGLDNLEDDLVVSPQHRMLVASKISERLLGNAEVLIAAKKLVDLEGVDRIDTAEPLVYYHILFDDHELVFANGVPAESLYMGKQAIKSMTPEGRSEIETLFPEVCSEDFVPYQSRPIIKGREVKEVVRRMVKNNKTLVDLHI